MPTYRNDGTTVLQVMGMSGETVFVQPGHIVYTENLLTETYMTKTADTPYYNPTFSWDIIRLGVAASGESSAINQTFVSGIDVYNRTESSGEADVYFNARANDLTARLMPGRSIEFTSDEVKFKVNKVVIATALGAVVEVRAKKW